MKTPHAHTNRLIDSTSPYLLQHAHNPVDWNPWGQEALERSRRENRPIFLSIGYSACHWCHVMEHLVFENPQLAALMNASFINIKVDREERPDLDEVYMLATQVMTGQGGWPMSVWLTPDLEPFYAGTYFPPEDGYGRPGFGRLITALAEAWSTREPDLRAQAAKVAEAVRMYLNEAEASADAGERRGIHFQPTLQRALEQWSDRFDDEHGGLGTAPKFPPSQALALWLELLRSEHALKEYALDESATRRVHSMLTTTLDAMMRGGIYDQIAGAFARYSTDQFWLVPHFEKMLYDNAQLAPVYAQAAADLHRPDYARIAHETLEFFLREMCTNELDYWNPDLCTPGGAFFSSLDADSEGEEGKYYVWTLDDVRAAMVQDDAMGSNAQFLIDHFGLTDDGNWHESPVPGGSVLAIAMPVELLAQKHKQSPDTIRLWLDTEFGGMRKYRNRRPRPAVDDKILTSWNGLMLSALAICGRLLPQRRNPTYHPNYLAAAEHLADFLLTKHRGKDGRLLRVSRNGNSHTEGFLDDYAFVLNGLLDLADSVRDELKSKTLTRAQSLADIMIEDFEDRARGGFFFTGPRHEQLFTRIKNASDGATPSANGVAIRALFRLAALTKNPEYTRAATAALQAFAPTIEKQPMQFPTILNALAHEQRAGPHLVATVARGGHPKDAKTLVTDDVLTLAAAPLDPVLSGSDFLLRFTLTIAPGYHIQSHHPSGASVTATSIRLRADIPLAAQQWTFPSTVPITAGDSTIEGYESTITIEARITLDPTAKPGLHTLRAILTAQPCRLDACLAPQTRTLEIPLHVIERTH